jgi:glycerophosphoryl diester phosphodiesterase
MLHESEEEEMDTYAVELNSFVDTILTKVYDLAGRRDILFSSFNPDICLLLSFKQPSIPVLFLTDAGASPVGDIRASSLQEAIRFASRWNLLGIVTQAEPLVLCPRLVRIVKESGLVCVSYGALNNDGENVDVSFHPLILILPKKRTPKNQRNQSKIHPNTVPSRRRHRRRHRRLRPRNYERSHPAPEQGSHARPFSQPIGCQ